MSWAPERKLYDWTDISATWPVNLRSVACWMVQFCAISVQTLINHTQNNIYEAFWISGEYKPHSAPCQQYPKPERHQEPRRRRLPSWIDGASNWLSIPVRPLPESRVRRCGLFALGINLKVTCFVLTVPHVPLCSTFDDLTVPLLRLRFAYAPVRVLFPIPLLVLLIHWSHRCSN